MQAASAERARRDAMRFISLSTVDFALRWVAGAGAVPAKRRENSGTLMTLPNAAIR
jgi:hypothetical protein